MIFGEFTQNEYGYEADGFDYHFRHKNRDGRKQNTTGRKGRRKLRRAGNSGAVMAANNFGLNSGNGNDANPNDVSSDTPNPQNDPGNSGTPPASNGTANAGGDNSAPNPDPQTNPAVNADAESSYDEPEKKDPVTKVKEGGMGAGFGWACLSITVLIISVVIARTVKGPADVSKHIHHHHTS